MKHLWTVFLIIAILLTGCTAYAGTPIPKSDSAQVEWAFTQAGQHPERQLIEVMDGAKHSLDIAIYSLTLPDIVDAIKRAKQRGVQVRIITDQQEAKGRSQAEALKLLGSAGIPIKVNTHNGLMHLKVTIADGQVATTGSYNYSKAASTDNDEVFVVIRDSKVAASFTQQFDKMWNDKSRFAAFSSRIAAKTPNGAARSQPAKAASCANPKIKGNITATGEKIYHMPGSRYYEQTRAERMFCTEAEAQAAGFRKSKE